MSVQQNDSRAKLHDDDRKVIEPELLTGLLTTKEIILDVKETWGPIIDFICDKMMAR